MDEGADESRGGWFLLLKAFFSRGAGLAMLMALACNPMLRPQWNEEIHIPHSTPPPGLGGASIDDPTVARHQQKELNAERQKEMISESNKLLGLARELNHDVAASGTEVLTPDDLRKLAEIEKLARSVKEKMAVEGGPVLPMAPSPYSAR